MPRLTGRGFKARHNKGLSPEKATKAAKIVNAMVKAGKTEGLAFAVANSRAEDKPSRNGSNAKARTGKTTRWTGK